MTALGGWQNFYVIVGSSAGALIGLQFVVMALVADLPRTPVQAQAGHIHVGVSGVPEHGDPAAGAMRARSSAQPTRAAWAGSVSKAAATALGVLAPSSAEPML